MREVVAGSKRVCSEIGHDPVDFDVAKKSKDEPDEEGLKPGMALSEGSTPALQHPDDTSVTVEESPQFLTLGQVERDHFSESFDTEWIYIGEPIKTLADERVFCDNEVVRNLVRAKTIFDVIDVKDIQEARKRANPYETISGALFQNRAAMKMANLDCIYEWKLSGETDAEIRTQHNPLDCSESTKNLRRNDELFYFADICAGPGGFSEYMMWRKGFYNSKGIGFTLRGKDDFKLYNFKASSAACFEAYYGNSNDGNVYLPSNIKSLEDYVRKRTNGRMCNSVMADGGFSVEGKEEIQEVVSKRIYLCQFLVGLSLCRVKSETTPGGNFICKMFDTFTTFSVGLIYVMALAFDSISIHKPNTSRPGNSERYIFCENLNEFGASVLKNYLTHVNEVMDGLPDDEDVLEIIPVSVMTDNTTFLNYIKCSNERWAERQIRYLQMYEDFALNKAAQNENQPLLRRRCLEYWEIPDRCRPYIHNQPPVMALRRLVPPTFTYPLPTPAEISSSSALLAELSPSTSPEFQTQLLPELTSPILLVTNDRGECFLLDEENSHTKLDHLYLPPRTLLLVQKSSLYTKNVSGSAQPCAKWTVVLYVVDAAWLAGDNISNCHLTERIRNVAKFCDAVNKRPESFVQDHEHRMERAFAQRKRNGRTFNAQYCNQLFVPSSLLPLNKLPEVLDNLHIGFNQTNRYERLALREYNIPEALAISDDSAEVTYLSCKRVRMHKPGHLANFFDSHERRWDWVWRSDPKCKLGPLDYLKDETNTADILTLPMLRKLV